MAGTQRVLQRLSTLPERFLAALLMSLKLSSHSLEIACKEDKKEISFSHVFPRPPGLQDHNIPEEELFLRVPPGGAGTSADG